MGQRLLLVDSDRRFIKDHQVALESAFDMEYLNSTEAVVSRLESGDFAAALICVEVSENKGYALCSAIRKNPKLTNVKVILISAKATEEEYARHRSLKGKADLYLHKPVISGSLVASLSSFVPPRAMDPDNPLGDLSGADLGDEWLESLKTELDSDDKPKAIAAPNVTIPVPSPAPVVVKVAPTAPSLATVALQVPSKTQNLPPVSPDAGKIALLEARVKDLEYKLQYSATALTNKDQELDELRNQQRAASRDLQAASGKSKEEIASLSAQLEEVEGDHQRLRVTVEDLGRQLTEREQEVSYLQQIRRDHEWRIGELQGLEGRLSEVQAEADRLRQADQARQALEQQVKGLQEQAGAAANAQREVEELRGKLERLNVEKQELQTRLEAEKQILLTRLETVSAELAEKNTEAEVARVDVAGLEATLRGQRRELADLENRLNILNREHQSLKEKTDEHGAGVKELKATILERDKALLEKSAELLDLREAEEKFRTQCVQMEKELQQLTSQHERQQMEILRGLDEKEALLVRLNATLESQRERIATLEQEKKGIEGHLNERTARLEALSGAVTDLENNIRRASDLTRPV